MTTSARLSSASETVPARLWLLPREAELGLVHAASPSGVTASLLPNGSLYALEHATEDARTLVNQVLGAPLDGGIGRIWLRTSAGDGAPFEIIGPRADVTLRAWDSGFAWEGETRGLRHRVAFILDALRSAWSWRVEITNAGAEAVSCDALFAQDLGLGDRGFVTNNEAYASQYIDHCIETHPTCGPVLMCRQNLPQGGGHHPWVAHACREGAVAWATDALQLFGPAFRASGRLDLPFGTSLPARRLQHEAACVSLQSPAVKLAPGASTSFNFVAVFVDDHPEASGPDDLTIISPLLHGAAEVPALAAARPCRRAGLALAEVFAARPLTPEEIDASYAARSAEENEDGELLSFFTGEGAGARHVVLAGKETRVRRRHGLILRSGRDLLPHDDILCATMWMEGIFGAQLTLGNTSFHKLFSVSRDAYGITAGAGLRLYVEQGGAWRRLAVPSLFDMGLADCRWIYAGEDTTIVVEVVASPDDPALSWTVSIEGAPCRVLAVGHAVMGERDSEEAASVEVDPASSRLVLRPAPDSMWGHAYPHAAMVWEAVDHGTAEAAGGVGLLADATEEPPPGPYVALRSRPVNRFAFTISGIVAGAEREITGSACPVIGSGDNASRWTGLLAGLHVETEDPRLAALAATVPWLVQDAIVHLSVPHGLEQYTGAAWGTRDVCQGPLEFALAFGHDATARDIILRIYAEQYEHSGDWSQWFMLPPYSSVRDSTSHGDIIIWPLKALCDYIQATGDIGILAVSLPWRREESGRASSRHDALEAHVEKQLATIRDRFLPGTCLISIGEGDWNDSLQPADPDLKENMVSSWTVALLYQQVLRYAAILEHFGRLGAAGGLRRLADHIRVDVERLLIHDGVIAGYAIFDKGRDVPELLLHPRDACTGVNYSLLPMIRAIAGGLFTPGETQRHFSIIDAHLAFPDGVRLMDRPMPYHGGLETLFRRAESAAFFGREIGLMYVHSHLQYAQALAAVGDTEALVEALLKVSPVSVGDVVPNASLRQRNTYFSSSDAAFDDRYQSDAEWERVGNGTIAVDGGWRIYSSGPGLFLNLLMRDVLGIRRHYGTWHVEPRLPVGVGRTSVVMEAPGRRLSWSSEMA